MWVAFVLCQCDGRRVHGNLYEGQVSDFFQDTVDQFQLKTNEKEIDRSDLQAVLDALESENAKVLSRLEAVVDLEQSRTFWAMETFLGHYAGSRLTNRLYNLPEQRQAYRDRIGELVDSVWDLANPPTEAMEAQRTVITEHPEIVRGQLAEQPPEWIVRGGVDAALRPFTGWRHLARSTW